jgi:hypothetical protein
MLGPDHFGRRELAGIAVDATVEADRRSGDALTTHA